VFADKQASLRNLSESAAVALLAKENESVSSLTVFDSLDHKNLRGSLLRVELQAELFLQSRE